MIPAHAVSHPSAPSTTATESARLVDVHGRALPLVAARLETRAGGGLARVLLEQRFHNPHDEPLRVTYQLPLPADAAVSGFVFTVGDERIRGQVKGREAARAELESALLEGRSGALLEQDTSSIFRQEIGNVPPGADVLIEIEIDQRLEWREGGWEWRFPTTVSPAFLGSPGRSPSADRRTVEVADGDPGARLTLGLRIDDELVGGAPRSPSHELAGEASALRFVEPDGARLDRDVVIRWPVAAPSPGAVVQTASIGADDPYRGSGPAGAFGMLTLVPPQSVDARDRVRRDLIVLIDTSGSMGGEPLDQARRVVLGLIDTLDEHDQLELIEFGSSPRRFQRGPLGMGSANRRRAATWVRKLRAGGGTMMRDGILAALAPLRADAQRQILLITDGLIGFESEIVEEIRSRLPAQSRVHTLGVGHGVNRSLTRPAARAGAGREVIVAPGEDVEPVLDELLAHTSVPAIVDLELSGTAVHEVVPRRIPDLYAGAPARIGLRLNPAGGTLVVTGRTGSGTWAQTLQVQATAAGEGNAALVTRFGRERVEDLELDRCAEGAHVREIDASIERIGIEFQIATRRTSFVATSEKVTVDASGPTRTVHQPHELTAGLSAEGVGLSRGMPVAGFGAGAVASALMAPPAPQAAPPLSEAQARMAPRKRSSTGVFGKLADSLLGGGGRGDATELEAADDEAFADAPAPAPEEKRERRRKERGERAKRKVRKKRDERRARRGGKGGGLIEWFFGGRTTQTLRGKVVLQADGKIVIEVAVDQPVRWDPAAGIVAFGEVQRPPNVDLFASTKAGRYSPGQTIRLVLLEDQLPDALRVGDIEVELS